MIDRLGNEAVVLFYGMILLYVMIYFTA